MKKIIYLLLSLTLISSTSLFAEPLPHVKSGDTITAAQYNQLVDSINELKQSTSNMIRGAGATTNGFMGKCFVDYISGDTYSLGRGCSEWVQSIFVAPGENGRWNLALKPGINPNNVKPFCVCSRGDDNVSACVRTSGVSSYINEVTVRTSNDVDTEIICWW